jgi:HemY protein
MRYYFLIFVLFVLIASFLGDFFLRDPGYVFVSLGSRVLETSFVFALFMLCFFAALLYGFFSLLGKIVASRIGLTKWLEARNVKSSQAKTAMGLIHFIEGRWVDAERLLLQGVKYNAYPLVNYLVMAKVADEMNSLERRNQYLQQAMKNEKNHSSLACALTQARIQYSRGEWEACLATLSGLYKEKPAEKAVLDLLVKVYEKLQDWQALFLLLPEIKKKKLMEGAEWEAFEVHIVKEWFLYMLSAHLKNENREKIVECWEKLPAHLKKQEPFIYGYAKHLYLLGDEVGANKMLIAELHRHWSDSLMKLFAHHSSQVDEEHLKILEKWLKDRPNHVVLLIALGRIYFKRQWFDRAIACLVSANALTVTTQAHHLLGEIYWAMKEYPKAAECFRLASEEVK